MKRITATVLTLIIAVLSVGLLTACGGSGISDASPASSTSEKAALYNINGVEVTAATVEMVGETPNLQITFANNTDEAIKCDISPLHIKTESGEEFYVGGLEKEIAANTPHAQNAMTFMNDPGVKLGDKVDICYGDDIIASVEVTEF